MIIVCKICKKESPHQAKGLCVTCYRRLQYRGFSKKRKKRIYAVAKKYREKNREKYNKTMRELMRKKFKIKEENYRRE